jgi:hypothetical protein
VLDEPVRPDLLARRQPPAGWRLASIGWRLTRTGCGLTRTGWDLASTGQHLADDRRPGGRLT